MQLGNFPHDGQPQAAAVAGGLGASHKALQHRFAQFGRQARATVGHLQAGRVGQHRNLDPGTGAGIAQRVVHQIAQRLAH